MGVVYSLDQIMSEEPKEPECAKDPEIELEARRDEAEDLRLEARRDGVKDIEREARIEELELAGDLVEEAKDPAIGKKGAFVRGDWDAGDRVRIAPAPVEKGWYAKSPRAQRVAIEKICGTYRVGGSPTTLTPTPGKGGVRLVRPGTLKDRYHGSKKVRDRNIEADAILIKATDKAPKPALVQPPPMVASVLIPGRCAHAHCPNKLPRGLRVGTKFCSNACKSADRRRRNARIVAGLAFKNPMNAADAMTFQRYNSAAQSMTGSADLAGFDAYFIGTSAGVLVISDGPLPPLTVFDPHIRYRNQVEVQESEHLSTDDDIVALVDGVRQREVASRNVALSNESDFLVASCSERIARLNAFLNMPPRKVLLLAFEPDTLTEHLRCVFNFDPSLDPFIHWWNATKSTATLEMGKTIH